MPVVSIRVREARVKRDVRAIDGKSKFRAALRGVPRTEFAVVVPARRVKAGA